MSTGLSPRPGSGSLMNIRRKNSAEDGPSTVSEPPPSPHQAYFDKYPKRAEQIRETKQDKHVTIEFPSIPERKPSSSKQGGLRDWRVVQAHLEPKAPRSSKRKIRDPDDMVIVSLVNTPDDHDRTPPANPNSYVWPSREKSNSTLFDHPSIISRSSVLSSAGTLTSATTEPGALTPPRTPTSPHEPVLIASSSVEAMDALIDSMAMGSTASLDSMPFLTPSYARNSRFYPLYQPPLPTPPEGVKLGIVQDAESWKPSKRKGKRDKRKPEHDWDDTETEADSYSRTPASSSSSVIPTPSTSRTPSLTAMRVKSDEEIEADERADVSSPLVPPARIRQRSGLSARSLPRNTPSVRSGRTISTSSSSSHKARIARSPGMWDIPQSGDVETASIDSVLKRSVVPSIDDIIKMHAPAVVAATKAASQRSAASKPPDTKPAEADDLFAPGHTSDLDSRTSVDSIADEAQRSLKVAPSPPTPRRPTTSPRLQHARSFTSSAPPESLSPYIRTPLSDGASICSGASGNTVVLPRNPGDPTMEMAQYLRSPRLTRLLTLRRPAHAGLTVSLADVGSLTGRPVIVYLGLGCVRYLVALYDEMAEALNLRLICIDRWGLGRTSDVPTDKRGLLEWAGVVEEVADTLGIGRYSVLAHSAGAPYALASSLKTGERVMGSVHLLAPWVSMAVDGGYKWLKYVPNGLIKTAQAAEWRLQGWMLGKPPTIQYQGIGFDANAPTTSPGRASFGSFSEYDELDDFDGRFASRTTLGVKDQEGVKKDKEGGLKKEGSLKKDKENKEKRKDPVSELDSRPRKGSKSIFGGLFNNTAPKRGLSTPAYPRKDEGREFETVRGRMDDTVRARADDVRGKLEDTVRAKEFDTVRGKPDDAVKELDTVRGKELDSIRGKELDTIRGKELDAIRGKELDTIRSEDDEPEPESPTTPLPPPPKLKGLRSMSSLKSRSAKSEPGKHTTVGLGLGLEAADADARTQAWANEFGDDTRPRQRRSLSLNARPVPMTPAPPSPRSPNPNPKTVTLASALLQASHAESLKGGTADLLSILERDSKPWGFSYADVRQPVRVWYGDRDDKIGIGSVRWMERVMKSCEVRIVKGAGHSLMTHAEVVVEVLESIAKEWDESRSY